MSSTWIQRCQIIIFSGLLGARGEIEMYVLNILILVSFRLPVPGQGRCAAFNGEGGKGSRQGHPHHHDDAGQAVHVDCRWK